MYLVYLMSALSNQVTSLEDETKPDEIGSGSIEFHAFNELLVSLLLFVITIIIFSKPTLVPPLHEDPLE